MTDFLFNDGVFTRQGQALSKFFESLHKDQKNSTSASNRHPQKNNNIQNEECESEQCDGEEHGEDVQQIEGLWFQ
ncbi:uncharacterized protein LOC130662619 isoform X2 [Hydractinia symbiolongicarpus]|uniref:uncharacterized protein LOC130662619 isoform X2 n=1 Tax=Hydractinia symbiolongicarpus TaxID=13093 RepID=UPI00254E0294|nr:uncharacterized protein LOC130662619 isoform X2 [Hydractinia symbiolongicarpus]